MPVVLCQYGRPQDRNRIQQKVEAYLARCLQPPAKEKKKTSPDMTMLDLPECDLRVDVTDSLLNCPQ